MGESSKERNDVDVIECDTGMTGANFFIISTTFTFESSTCTQKKKIQTQLKE